MKRIINPTQAGGFPYQNSDFYNILQDEQYSVFNGMLNTIRNSSLPVTGNTNTGVIVSGLDIITSGTTSSNIQLSNYGSLVYLNGMLMKYASTDGIINTGTGTVYIVEASPVIEQRIFADGVTKNATETRVFTTTTTLPTSGEYIKIDWQLGCSRYMNNLLFNNSHSIGDIEMVTNISLFLASGLGTGKYTGWAIADGRNGTFNLSDKVVMGYNSTGLTTPTSSPAINQVNTGQIGNVGGSNAVALTEAQLPVVDKTIQASVKNIPIGVRLTTAGSGGVDNTVRTWDGSNSNRIYNITAETDIQTRVLFGSNDVHENRMPYIVMAYIQKIS